MAGMFYRKPKISDSISATKLYGFKKANKAQVTGITRRLSETPTVNYRAHSATTSRYDELYERVVSVCPHICCHKDGECTCVHAVGGHEAKRLLQRRFEKSANVEKQNKLIQRLQRPTTASSNKSRPTRNNFEDNDEFDVIPEDEYEMQNLAQQHRTEKLLARIQLPTETSMYKRWNGRCWYCDCVHVVDLPPEMCKAEEKTVKQDELVEILDRLKTPICSNGTNVMNKGPCDRFHDIQQFEHRHRQNWPLWCGLERSKTVEEITRRLYSPGNNGGDSEVDSSEEDDNPYDL